MKNQQPLRNYNIFYLQGDEETTDMDVVETLGLDPAIAYTPSINDAAIEKMRKENIEAYIAEGIEVDKAKEMANFHANAAKASVRAAMRDGQDKDFLD
jgi:hypothetical protein